MPIINMPPRKPPPQSPAELIEAMNERFKNHKNDQRTRDEIITWLSAQVHALEQAGLIVQVPWKIDVRQEGSSVQVDFIPEVLYGRPFFHEERNGVHMLIDRLTDIKTRGPWTYFMTLTMHARRMAMVLESRPPAQPEQCSVCSHWQPTVINMGRCGHPSGPSGTRAEHLSPPELCPLRPIKPN